MDIMSSTNPFDDPHDNVPSSLPVTLSNIKYPGTPTNNQSVETSINENKFEADSQTFTTSKEKIRRPLHDKLNDDSRGHAYSYDDSQNNITSENKEMGSSGTKMDLPSEESWKLLGELPYRKVVFFNNVKWGHTKTIQTKSEAKGLIQKEKPDEASRNKRSGSEKNYGLATYTQPRDNSHTPSFMDAHEYENYLSSTLTTLIAGCPNGGPIAVVTIPKDHANPNDFTSSTELSMTQKKTIIRITTSSGRLLASIPFPPTLDSSHDTIISNSFDILTIGFTTRCNLIVVLRNSLCLTYTLSGKVLIPPFYILPHDPSSTHSIELIDAHVYEGGVAVLSTGMNCAIVELLDDIDEEDGYIHHCHVTSRRINSHVANNNNTVSYQSHKAQNFAIITPLATAAYAGTNYYSYTTLAVLDRKHTSSRHPEIFLATSDNTVLIADTQTGDITDVDCRSCMSSPIAKMSFAPNGRFLACFTQSSILTVISTSFETKVLDFDTSEGSSAAPEDIQWCGEDSVIMYWKDLGILMVGPYGDWLRFPYDGDSGTSGGSSSQQSHLKLVPEMDGCRVITDKSIALIQRVPPATAALLRVGSIEPAAMLLDASDAFESGSPSSDEAARAIMKTGMLHDAIEVCMDAAVKEFDVNMQKRLLRAASYGMHFSYKNLNGTGRGGNNRKGTRGGWGHVSPSPTAITFVKTSRKLRIMNALRDISVGFTLTSSQYDGIGEKGIIARLIAMKRPALATSLCTYLQMDKRVHACVRAERASAFVAVDQGHTDAQTAEKVIKFLNQGPDIESSIKITNSANNKTSKGYSILNRGGYAKVALTANQAGRPGVASLLLMLETSVLDKVYALAEIGSYLDAATVATNSR